MKLLTVYSFNSKNMLSIGVWESCGVPLLGSCTMILSKALGKEFKVDYEVPIDTVHTHTHGRNPVCVASLAITTTTATGELIPVVLNKYKATVNIRPNHVNAGDFLEVLVQGYHRNITTCLHCLTDMFVFHYFKLCKSGNGLEIEWRKTFGYKPDSLPSLEAIKGALWLCYFCCFRHVKNLVVSHIVYCKFEFTVISISLNQILVYV